MPADPEPREVRDVEERLSKHCGHSHGAIVRDALAAARTAWEKAFWEIREAIWAQCADAIEKREAAESRADRLAEALKEIAHAEGYDGSLCADPEDCPNCAAREALDYERGEGK